jgi:hypothetical protein
VALRLREKNSNAVLVCRPPGTATAPPPAAGRVVGLLVDPTGPDDHAVVVVEAQVGVSKKWTWRIWNEWPAVQRRWSSRALRTACRRPVTPSLRKMPYACVFTVLRETYRSEAISSYVIKLGR